MRDGLGGADSAQLAAAQRGGEAGSECGQGVTPEKVELSRLRAEVAELREENTTLRKATAYMDTELVTSALDMAYARRPSPPGLLYHSSRGSQYASHAFQQRLRRYGMRCSMRRRGNCWDNVPTESWLKSCRRIAIRYDKLATSFSAMFTLACIRRCLRHYFSYKT
ncbi:hypothetical protein EBL84_03980 [Marichromatium sp. AB31]|nr:hypothetical protein [Marichromatium gracile]RNE91185.1 hypothetical protein EBL84_03980 [Marichromatium sp. AB31]